MYTRIYGRATRALDSSPYLLAFPRQGQRLPLSHAQLSFCFRTKNVRSGKETNSACERTHNNPNRPPNVLTTEIL